MRRENDANGRLCNASLTWSVETSHALTPRLRRSWRGIRISVAVTMLCGQFALHVACKGHSSWHYNSILVSRKTHLSAVNLWRSVYQRFLFAGIAPSKVARQLSNTLVSTIGTNSRWASTGGAGHSAHYRGGFAKLVARMATDEKRDADLVLGLIKCLAVHVLGCYPASLA